MYESNGDEGNEGIISRAFCSNSNNFPSLRARSVFPAFFCASCQTNRYLLTLANFAFRELPRPSRGLERHSILSLAANSYIPFCQLFSDMDNPDCLDFRANRNKNLK